MLDMSHLNEAGFWDVARPDRRAAGRHPFQRPCRHPSSRNLTDKQLAAIRESGGMVGLNFSVSFLREDGRRVEDTGWDPILRHMDHLLDRLGEDHLGFGSDYDGCTTPAVIGDVGGLPRLMQALADHGYDAPLLRKLAQDNWLRVLGRTWGG
jgi:membrane dipeptidase